jgi:hypothetical protein
MVGLDAGGKEEAGNVAAGVASSLPLKRSRSMAPITTTSTITRPPRIIITTGFCFFFSSGG